MGGDGTLDQAFYIPKIECEMEGCHELANNFVWISDTGTTILLCKRHYRAQKDKLQISTVINELEIMEEHNPVDAIHYAGGCYCRECEEWTGVVLGSRCKRFSFPPNSWICTKPDDFCSYGRRREGVE